MAQHDYDIANQSFPAFRTDLNGVLEAINTSNSGTSRPSSAVAGTVWLDVTNATNPTLKFFDGTDDISLAQLDYTANTVNWLDSTVTISPLTTDLDVGGNSIVSVSNGNITFTPDGTGKVIIDGLSHPTSDGTSGQNLITDGAGNLSFSDVTPADNTVSLAKLTATGTKDATTFLRGDNTFAEAGGGITMADQFRLSADQSGGTNAIITSNLERVDTDGFGQLGTGMTLSSGVFSFPSTGIYNIIVTGHMTVTDSDSAGNLSIETTTDNSTFNDACIITAGVLASGGCQFSVRNNFIFDVTNTSTHKFHLKTHSMGGGSYLMGETDRNRTTITVIRLGDT